MTRPDSTFVQLVRTSSRELFRDGKTAFFVVGFPLFFMAMFIGIGFITNGGSYRVGVAPGPDQAQLVEKLGADKDLTIVAMTGPVSASSGSLPGALDGNDVIVRTVRGRTLVTVDAGKFGVVRGLRKALDHGMAKDDRALFQTQDGSAPFDPIKSALPTALFIALMSAAFFGTATPMIGLRQRGTLRMLSTTPLHRRTFILSQLPVRLLLVTVQLVIVGGIAALAGFLALRDVLPVLLGGLLGALMLFGFGYLIAARMRNAEVANGLLAVIMPVTMFFGGLFLPMSLLPMVIRDIAEFLPTTYLVDSLSHSFTGSPSLHGIGVDWLVLSGSAIFLSLLAARLFNWDAGDER